MRWLKRDLWKTDMTIVGMWLIAWVPESAADAYEVTSGFTGSVTVQVTPTEDVTVTTLHQEKLAQEVQQLKNQNEPDPLGRLRTNASILLSTLGGGQNENDTVNFPPNCDFIASRLAAIMLSGLSFSCKRLPIQVLVLIPLVVASVVVLIKRVYRRKALEQIRERYASGLALVRYVQLNRQCSETVAYQRLANFVKQHVPFDDADSIERMLAHDRQSLLAIAQGLLVQNPDEIDKI